MFMVKVIRKRKLMKMSRMEMIRKNRLMSKMRSLNKDMVRIMIRLREPEFITPEDMLSFTEQHGRIKRRKDRKSEQKENVEGVPPCMYKVH